MAAGNLHDAATPMGAVINQIDWLYNSLNFVATGNVNRAVSRQ